MQHLLHQVWMDRLLIFVFPVLFQPCLSVLFTIEAEQTRYMSEFGGDVVMACRFQPVPSQPRGLKVTWHWLTSTAAREVYLMDNGQEQLASQDPGFRGRVTLLTEELPAGWVKLQVSRLRMNDSGVYQCLVQTEEGADYKDIHLSVTAPYKSVSKHIQRAADGAGLLLSCQSEGYPKTAVVWRDARLQIRNSNTSSVSMPDQRFKVTSQLYVSSSDKNNYTCNFTRDGFSATFHIPEDTPAARDSTKSLLIVLGVGVILLGAAAVVFYHRDKGLRIRRRKEEEKSIFNEGCTEENMEAFLKAHYSNRFLNTETGRHMEASLVEDITHRLQSMDESRPVTLQSLIPEDGGSCLLEGPPGSGKTTAAYILVSSWAEGPTEVVGNLLDLNTIHVFIYVDCSSPKGDLFQEITSQLSRGEKFFTQDELRTLLTRSDSSLLLLDGYKEGNRCFDESLKRFLLKRRGCRVLVMSCPEHCPSFKERVETGGLLELQTQTAKY